MKVGDHIDVWIGGIFAPGTVLKIGEYEGNAVLKVEYVYEAPGIGTGWFYYNDELSKWCFVDRKKLELIQEYEVRNLSIFNKEDMYKDFKEQKDLICKGSRFFDDFISNHETKFLDTCTRTKSEGIMDLIHIRYHGKGIELVYVIHSGAHIIDYVLWEDFEKLYRDIIDAK